MHRRTILPLAALLLATLSGCGSDSPSGPEGGGGGGSEFYMSARIDGTAWTADPSLITAAGTAEGTPGMLSFQGSSLAGGGRSIVIHLARIPGVGTYPLGVNIGTGTGGIATYAAGSQGWNTALSGAAGTITISAISASTVTGTFQFEATRADGGGGSITVGEGRFHVPRNPGFTPATADQLGNRVSGVIDGSPWNAATVVAAGNPESLAGINAANDRYSVTISFGPVDGPGSGPLAPGVPVRRVSVQRIGSAGGWGGTNLDVGTLTIRTLTPARIAGTISATLAPVAGATGTLQLTDMEFDVRR